MIGKGNAAPNGHIPFTPHAKQVLEFSLREALQLGHSYIGTEHILLGPGFAKAKAWALRCSSRWTLIWASCAAQPSI